MTNQVKSIYLRNVMIDIARVDFTNVDQLIIVNLYLISKSFVKGHIFLKYIRYVYLGKSGQIYCAT